MRPRLVHLVLPIAFALLAPRVHPQDASARTEDPLDELSARLQAARMEFESALAVPAEELDVVDASRRFDEALLELRGELEALRDRGAAERPGARRLLLQSSGDELDLSWARLHEVASVTPHIRALARLHGEMQALLDDGRPRDAIRLFEARLPEPLDPLDWPAVVRRRLRDVERLAQTARTAASPSTEPAARAERDARPR